MAVQRLSETCSVEGCSFGVKTRGFCSMHYERVRKTGDPGVPHPIYSRHDPLATEKKCRSCDEVKPIDGFHVGLKQRDGRESICKLCDRILAFARRNGFPVEEVRKFVQDNESNGCKICGRHDDLVIDHCHETHVLRGILCRTCNVGVGAMRHDPEVLRSAIVYLEESLCLSFG